MAASDDLKTGAFTDEEMKKLNACKSMMDITCFYRSIITADRKRIEDLEYKIKMSGMDKELYGEHVVDPVIAEANRLFSEQVEAQTATIEELKKIVKDLPDHSDMDAKRFTIHNLEATVGRLRGALEKAEDKLKVCKAHIQQMDSEYVPSEEMQMKCVNTQACIAIDAVAAIARKALDERSER